MKALLITLLLGVAACTSYEEKCAAEFGFQPGTSDYFVCVQTLEQARQARITRGLAVMQGGGALMNQANSTGYGGTSCLATQQGVFTQTTCR